MLTGTPLGQQDLRHDYQNAYRTVAARLMALIVLVQNTDLLSQVTKAGMGAISMPAAPATTGLRIQWKPGISMDEVQQLLRTTSTSVMDGPDVEGFYRLKSSNPMAAKRALSQSHLVRHVLIP